MAKLITPLAPNVPIVDENGNPTPYFQRVLQELTDNLINEIVLDGVGGDPGDNRLLVWDNTTGVLTFATLSDVIDWTEDTHGSILFRGATEWQALTPGDDGDVLTTHDAGADPTWETPSTGGGSTAWTLIDQNGAAIVDQTFTITIASPGVVTCNAHGYSNNTRVSLSTSGALPTGLDTVSSYYVKNVTANTFELSATVGGASINTTGTQSGTHNVIRLTTWSYSTAVANVDVINLAPYNELLVVCDAVGCSSGSGIRCVRASVDNGASYISANVYFQVSNTGIPTSASVLLGHNTGTTANRTWSGHVRNLKGLYKTVDIPTTAGAHTLWTEPQDMNALRFLDSGGANLVNGHFSVYAR